MFLWKTTVSSKKNIGGKTMAYTKPQVVAQNAAAGSYAAGCPANRSNTAAPSQCKSCERTA